VDLRKIKKLIELLEDSALSEMEITEGENTIRLSRSAPRRPAAVPPATTEPPAGPPAADPPPGPAPVAGNTVVSPLVGTFYDSPSPDQAPYVKVGSAVQRGDTLCLIEAMKTFNQIDAEIAGVVTLIHKNSGEPVEYGEPLFVIDSGGG